MLVTGSSKNFVLVSFYYLTGLRLQELSSLYKSNREEICLGRSLIVLLQTRTFSFLPCLNSGLLATTRNG